MDADLRARLGAKGLVHPDADGRDAVHVTLQLQQPIEHPSRTVRRERLQAVFDEAAAGSPSRVTLHPDSLSVSGQAIDAVVPTDDFDDLTAHMSKQGIRLDVAEPQSLI